jgi:hypothetical protein
MVPSNLIKNQGDTDMLLLSLAFLVSDRAFADDPCDVNQPIPISELRDVFESCNIPVGTRVSVAVEEVDVPPPRPGIGFRVNDVELNHNGKDTLDGVATLLTARKKLHIKVIGYADPRETGDLVGLSYRRAEIATKYLLDKGIESGRVEAVAGGVEVLIDTTGTYEGQARNRRVEFVILVPKLAE